MEEFSFPTAIVTDQEPISHLPFPSFTTTTSLWFHSPEADSSSHLRRSFSEGGANIATTCRRALRPSGSPAALSDCDDGLMEYEERMDMLWEDFNEEIYRASLERDRAATSVFALYHDPSPSPIGTLTSKSPIVSSDSGDLSPRALRSLLPPSNAATVVAAAHESDDNGLLAPMDRGRTKGQ